ncbi:MAG: hypothetical protein J0I24_10875 [Thiomonas arsenitoxydans]|uniref:Uncharacterized protein n=1 Tax=Thiomonas arsenitoxydans (strain DSM 22701 / CIP 110005 / 3As) TaxID=426114 RepID=A0A8I1MX87_THIA3|nr:MULTISPECIES: hypothetical protein [Thiomonas]MBN8744794.1 hypothetical protein [Thiomonas arsenitoxydans]ODU95570.1 MAG: hypothetical protein ABT24_11585 [Thiomonas sp. SCN 64-16]
MALPEKDWYTLDEIAQRWGCSVDDLWHYAEAKPPRLRLSMRFALPLPIKWQNAEPADLRLDALGDYHMTTGPLGIDASTLGRAMRSRKNLFSMVLPPVFDEEKPFVYGFIAWDDPECPEVCKLIPKDDDEQPELEAQGPLITREERDRFEKLHRVGAHAGAMPTDEEILDARERTTLLRMLAVLIADAGLPEQPHKAAEVLASMAAQHGLTLPTEKTCAEKITQARKASKA